MQQNDHLKGKGAVLGGMRLRMVELDRLEWQGFNVTRQRQQLCKDIVDESRRLRRETCNTST
jgi:hypothetical protein